jgi:oligoendopeptidase F
MRDTIPSRSEVKKEDTWDLSKLFSDDASWYSALKEYETLAEKIPGFRGTLGKSAESLADYLDFARSFGILEEKLAYYSDLRQTEDEGDSAARTMTGKFTMAAARAQTAGAWAAPEIQAIPDADMNAWFKSPRLAEYLIYLKRLLRYKPHILGEKEERIIALHAEGEGLSNDAFSVLTNVDMNFGTMDTPEGPKPLSQSTWTVFMEAPDRPLRKDAYTRFYSAFEAHQHTLAALYSGSVKQDAILARTRNYPSARAAALFPASTWRVRASTAASFPLASRTRWRIPTSAGTSPSFLIRVSIWSRALVIPSYKPLTAAKIPSSSTCTGSKAWSHTFR